MMRHSHSLQITMLSPSANDVLQYGHILPVYSFIALSPISPAIILIHGSQFQSRILGRIALAFMRFLRAYAIRPSKTKFKIRKYIRVPPVEHYRYQIGLRDSCIRLLGNPAVHCSERAAHRFGPLQSHPLRSRCVVRKQRADAVIVVSITYSLTPGYFQRIYAKHLAFVV